MKEMELFRREFEQNTFIKNLFHVLLFDQGNTDPLNIERVIAFIIARFCQNIIIPEQQQQQQVEESPCPFCLEPLSSEAEPLQQNNGCSHVFHKSCYYRWMKINATCPICRHNPASLPSPSASEGYQC